MMAVIERIHWLPNGGCDTGESARVGRFFLRHERMSNKNWRWSVRDLVSELSTRSASVLAVNSRYPPVKKIRKQAEDALLEMQNEVLGKQQAHGPEETR